jgi:hypothetical protein
MGRGDVLSQIYKVYNVTFRQMTRFGAQNPFIFAKDKRNLSSCAERTNCTNRRQVMTKPANTTPSQEPLWVLPSLYALSLGLFVPGILRASTPIPAPNREHTNDHV